MISQPTVSPEIAAGFAGPSKAAVSPKSEAAAASMALAAPGAEPALRIQRCTAAHVAAVLAIDAQVYGTPWSERLLRDDIDHPDRCHLVALDRTASQKGQESELVVGHASLLTVVDEGHITTVATDPAWQRRGVARALVLALCRHAMAIELQALTLEVRAGNRAAQGLYRQFGFAPVGVRARYYEPEGEDALIMWAHDILGPDYQERLDAVGRSISAGSTPNVTTRFAHE